MCGPLHSENYATLSLVQSWQHKPQNYPNWVRTKIPLGFGLGTSLGRLNLTVKFLHILSNVADKVFQARFVHRSIRGELIKHQKVVEVLDVGAQVLYPSLTKP